mgnify:CR=1 FL=1
MIKRLATGIWILVVTLGGVDAAVTTLHLATSWTDRAHQASAYRAGRVLPARAAAHTPSPLRGPGLNLGPGDAPNLGRPPPPPPRGHSPAGPPAHDQPHRPLARTECTSRWLA